MLRVAAGLVLMLGLVLSPHGLAAQDDETLMPEQSAAKAKAILQQVIAVMGGPAYLNVRDSDCTGRVAQFGHSGELMGFTPFRDMWLLPDKHRTEYTTKSQNSIAGALIGIEGPGVVHGGTVINLFNGDQGWTLDKGGVSDQPEDAIKTFVEQVNSRMDNVLRSGLNGEGVELRYAGTDLVDLKEVEWVEISDPDDRTFRVAVEKYTHLPIRWVVSTRDPETRERGEDLTSYGQFILFDGVKTPIRVSSSKNGREVSQTVFESCKYNSSLSPDLFTRASLEQRYAQVGKKGNKGGNDKKDSQNDKNNDKN